MVVRRSVPIWRTSMRRQHAELNWIGARDLTAHCRAGLAIALRANRQKVLVSLAISWLKKFPMHFGPRRCERRSHSRAMATTNNDAFGAKGAERIHRINGRGH